MVKSPANQNNLNLDSYSVLDLLNSLSTAVILAHTSGRLLAANKVARTMLDTYDIKQKSLKEIANTVFRSKNVVMLDQPVNGRIVRLYGQYLNLPDNKPLILLSLRDATEDWMNVRRQDILEYTASTFAQSIHNPEWIKSVLNRIIVMMNIQSANVMLYEPKNKLLHDLTDFDKKIKIGEGPAGKAAKLLKTIVAYNSQDHRKQRAKVGQTHSLLAVPMTIGNKLVGVLNIRDKADKYFSEQDKIFYSIIANRFALAIEHRMLLTQLKRQSERLATVINNTQHGMALLDNNGIILTANAAFAEIFGQEMHALENKKIKDLLPELKILFKARTNQMSKEMQLNSLEGKPWVKITATRTTSNRNSNIVLTILDITSQKNLEKIKNDFIATATHELRTPVTAIMGYLSMLANKSKGLDTKQKYYLQRINEASSILFELVEDLLIVLRLEQEKTSIKTVKQSLRAVIKRVVLGLETKIKDKNLKLVVPKNNVSAYADSGALKKVLNNLIDNAVKYTKPGGTISIEIKTISRGRAAKIFIKDTGIGISQKEGAKIFEKFYRIPNELSIEAGGTGLGLYISKKLVEQWRGILKLEKSGPGGSTFSFTVPTIKIR